MEHVNGLLGAQQVRLARCGGATAHVHGTRGARGTHDHRAPRAILLVRVVRDADAWDLGDVRDGRGGGVRALFIECGRAVECPSVRDRPAAYLPRHACHFPISSSIARSVRATGSPTTLK